MSYSFGARAATLALALESVSSELDSVVENQPIHSADRGAAYETAEQLGNLLNIDDSRDVLINVNGSCTGGDDGLTSVSLNVSISQAARETGDDTGESDGTSDADAEASSEA